MPQVKPRPRDRAALECFLHLSLAFEVVEILQELQPNGLLGVVEFATAAGLVVDDGVEFLDGLPNLRPGTSTGSVSR